MTQAKTQPRDFTTGFNRVMYGLMVLLSIYHVGLNNDLASAMSSLGIALIFDPFRPEISWSKRPLYQKVVLMVHLSLVLLLIGILVYNYFAR